MVSHAHERRQEVPIRFRRTLGGHGMTTEALVFCHETGHWTALNACRHCATATLSTPEREADWRLLCEREPIASAGELRNPLVSVAMLRELLCVEPKVRIEPVVSAFLEYDAEIAVVIDANGHLIGELSAAELFRAPSRATAEEAMSPSATTLLESTPALDALQLMVTRDIHHLPILSAGKVVGIVTPFAMLRWLATFVPASTFVRRGA